MRRKASEQALPLNQCRSHHGKENHWFYQAASSGW